MTTTYPVRVDLIPISPRQRSGYKARTPRRSVQHGNGNPNSSAQGERNFLHGLVGSDTWISYHATADDKELFVLVPLDEVTWQAADGNGPGNWNGLSCEMVEDAALWADPARRARCIHTCADFMGRCAARLKIAQPERHFDFNWVECCDAPCDVLCGNRHHCPDKLMSTGLWASSYVPQWLGAKNAELSGGGAVTMYPEGLDEDLASKWFGKVTGPDNRTYSYNEQGPVSQLWLSQGKATGEWPTLKAVEMYDTRKYFRFASGLTIWQPNESVPVEVLK